MNIIFLNNKMEYVMMPGTNIYKRSNSKRFDLTITEPKWFGLDDKILEEYGSHLHKLRVGRDLKLLNIMTWDFKMEFMDRLHKYFEGKDIEDDNLRRLKGVCIIALGIPNVSIQYDAMKKYIETIPEQKIDDYMMLDTSLCMGQRLSDKTIDKEFANILKKLYENEYDGYIQPFRIATIWMGLFPAEVCLFDLSKCNLESLKQTAGKTKKSKRINQKGGDEKDVWYHKMNDTMWKPGEYLTQTNALSRLLLRYDGFTIDEIESMKDSKGYVVMPDMNTRIQRRNSSKNIILKEELEELRRPFPKGKIKVNVPYYPRDQRV